MNIDDAVRLIEAHPDFSLLRRIPSVTAWRFEGPAGELRRGVFLDTETTGLDLESDEVIELALVPFDYERDSGRIVAVHHENAFTGLRQPSFPISAESTRIHGLTDADVAGKAIDQDAVARTIADAQLIIAHNAAFDRPMAEKHWSVFAEKNWACSLVDVVWKDEGLGGAKLDYLLWKQGFFYEAHRALDDALAGLFLLTQPLPLSKRPALAALLERARRPLRAVRAEETAFEQRAALKARGYRWDAGDGRRAKAWWILTDTPDDEIAWLRAEIYRDDGAITVVNVPATRRYSSRVWPAAT